MATEKRPDSKTLDENAFGLLSPKERLIDVLNETESVCAPLQRQAQELTEIAREQRDLAFALKKAVVSINDDTVFHSPNWDRVEQAWKSQNDEARKAARNLSNTCATLVLQTTSTGVSTSTAVVSTFLMPTSAMLKPFEGQDVAEQIDALLGRKVSIIELRNSFERFGLGSPRGGIRSPLDLLNDADLALKRPPREEPSPASVLIPLRQAIEGAIDGLLKRIPPPQEPAQGIERKICLIGRRCSKGQCSERFYSALGADARAKLDLLSSAGKDRSVTRQQMMIFFHDGMLFLKALFDSLDAGRFRARE